MLEHDTVDADGVLTRVPLPFAYASAWAKTLDYRLVSEGPTQSLYAPKTPAPKQYYVPLIEAGKIHVKAATTASTFSLYFRVEPLSGDVSCDVGMYGEPFPEDALQDLMLAVRHLPYSTVAIEKLIEKSDWLDANPMYRGLPGVAKDRSTPGQSVDPNPPTRALDWD